jgi:hypothetical protein
MLFDIVPPRKSENGIDVSKVWGQRGGSTAGQAFTAPDVFGIDHIAAGCASFRLDNFMPAFGAVKIALAGCAVIVTIVVSRVRLDILGFVQDAPPIAVRGRALEQFLPDHYNPQIPK